MTVVTGERVRFALECLGWLDCGGVVCAHAHTGYAAARGAGPERCPVGPVPDECAGADRVVPAKDEAETVRPAMETLLAQEYEWLKIVALDDRSTDATGALLDELAAKSPEKLDVVHITETAEGWMGKTFAMEVATQRSRSEYVLFTDADVWFSPSILRRALAYAEIAGADHLVIAPTPVTKTWGERAMISFLQMLAMWASRPWRVADPKARRDVAGAGAFNMVRREALEQIGGLAPQRLSVVEDVTLGQRMRAAGMQQRLVFAPGLVLVHWAPGAFGIIRGLTKNLFALANFRLPLAAVMMGGVFALFVLPLVSAGLVADDPAGDIGAGLHGGLLQDHQPDQRDPGPVRLAVSAGCAGGLLGDAAVCRGDYVAPRREVAGHAVSLAGTARA